MIKIEKPWGNYVSLYTGEISNGLMQIKTLRVETGGRLSLQSHKFRKEFWLVVDGSPTVELDASKRDYFIGDLIVINPGRKHRLSNQYTNTVVIVEIQIGSYLGEDDIVRHEDDYNRNDDEEMENIESQIAQQLDNNSKTL